MSLFESWMCWYLYFSDSALHSCMRNELWIHEVVMKFLLAQFPRIWSKCLRRNFNHLKIFNLTRYREVFTAHYTWRNSRFKFGTRYLNDRRIQFSKWIITSLIESWGVRLTCLDCKNDFVAGYARLRSCEKLETDVSCLFRRSDSTWFCNLIFFFRNISWPTHFLWISLLMLLFVMQLV